MAVDRNRVLDLGFSDTPATRKDGKHASFHPDGGLARAGVYKNAMPVSWEVGVDADGKRAWAKRTQSVEVRSEDPAEIAAFAERYLGRLDVDTGIARCTFCMKTRFEVKKLIAGPEVNICDECVERCYDIVNDELPTEEQPKGGLF